MKKTDVAMIILIASVSVMVAYFTIGAIPGLNTAGEPVKVKTMDKYSAAIGEPDSTVFNSKAINPTIEVTIGQGQATQGQ